MLDRIPSGGSASILHGTALFSESASFFFGAQKSSVCHFLHFLEHSVPHGDAKCASECGVQDAAVDRSNFFSLVMIVRLDASTLPGDVNLLMKYPYTSPCASRSVIKTDTIRIPPPRLFYPPQGGEVIHDGRILPEMEFWQMNIHLN